jgi:hypothetical protein
VRDAAASDSFFSVAETVWQASNVTSTDSRFKHLRTEISVRQRTISSNHPEII